ncbi:MAG: hypothetical protein ACODAA_00525 [Gemmatimonadota bacterium]
MQRTDRRLWLLFCLVPVLAACGDAGQSAPDASAFTTRDSAGVEIARSTGPAWSEGRVWALVDSPMLAIGSADGGADALYSVGPIVPLSDGRFALAHRSRNEIVWFDSTGTRLVVAGGDGDGPGEFRAVSDLFRLAGDSLLAVDGRLNRLSVFGPDGRYERSSRLEFEDGSARPIVLLPDRTLLARPGFSFGTGTSPGVLRDTAALPRFGLDGERVGQVAPVPTGENWVFEIGGSTGAGPHPFGKKTLLAPAEAGFWLTTGDRPEVELRAPDGELRRIVRWADRPPALTDEMAGSFEASMSDDPEDRQAVEAYLQDMEYPETLPTASELMSDTEGHLWVRPFEPYFEDEAPPPFMVFDPDGRLLGEVGFPERFDPRAITADRVYGVWTDELDIEQVRVYELRRD